MPAKPVYPTNPKHPRRDVLTPPSFFWHTWNQARKGLSNWLHTCSEATFEPVHFFRVVPANRKLANISILKKGKVEHLISFYDKVTHLADQEKLAEVIFLDFSKAFNTISHSILPDTVASTQLDKHVM